MPEHVHVHERISYGSDFITSFKTNVNTISKKVRKQIFAHRIWKPRNKERHTLLAVKPLVQSKHLNFVCLNIRSVKNKTTSLFDFIVSHNLDVLALTETWLCNGDNIILNELLPPGYDIRHVKSSTHQKGHILDLVITREHSNLLKRPPVVFISGVSDVKSSSFLYHFAVLCYLNVNRPKSIHKSFRNIPVPDYRNDVKVLMCNRRKPQKNIDDLINNYNATLQKLTDKYAPIQCKTIPLRPHAPWYTRALRQEKRVRRRSERVAARTMLEVARQIVQDMYRRRTEQLAKTSYFTKKVE